nr:unnamed protein product [Callosobruchus analis]
MEPAAYPALSLRMPRPRTDIFWRSYSEWKVIRCSCYLHLSARLPCGRLAEQNLPRRRALGRKPTCFILSISTHN